MNCCGSHEGHKDEKKISWVALVIMIFIILLLILSAFAFH